MSAYTMLAEQPKRKCENKAVARRWRETNKMESKHMPRVKMRHSKDTEVEPVNSCQFINLKAWQFRSYKFNMLEFQTLTF